MTLAKIGWVLLCSYFFHEIAQYVQNPESVWSYLVGGAVFLSLVFIPVMLIDRARNNRDSEA